MWDPRPGDKADIFPLLARERPRVDQPLYKVPHEDRATRKESRSYDPLVPPGGVVTVDHGLRGALCAALGSWARSRSIRPVRHHGLCLYGTRLPTSLRRSERT